MPLERQVCAVCGAAICPGVTWARPQDVLTCSTECMDLHADEMALLGCTVRWLKSTARKGLPFLSIARPQRVRHDWCSPDDTNYYVYSPT